MVFKKFRKMKETAAGKPKQELHKEMWSDREL